jgi:hypothetical protein
MRKATEKDVKCKPEIYEKRLNSMLYHLSDELEESEKEGE